MHPFLGVPRAMTETPTSQTPRYVLPYFWGVSKDCRACPILFSLSLQLLDEETEIQHNTNITNISSINDMWKLKLSMDTSHVAKERWPWVWLPHGPKVGLRNPSLPHLQRPLRPTCNFVRFQTLFLYPSLTGGKNGIVVPFSLPRLHLPQRLPFLLYGIFGE